MDGLGCCTGSAPRDGGFLEKLYKQCWKKLFITHHYRIRFRKSRNNLLVLWRIGLVYDCVSDFLYAEHLQQDQQAVELKQMLAQEMVLHDVCTTR